MTNKTFQFEFNKEELRELRKLLDFNAKNHPFLTESLFRFQDRIYDVLNYGCFKHNILTVKVNTGVRETLRFCPKCEQKLYKKYFNK